MDHYCSVHCARHDPACLHRCRTARPRRVPGWIPRPDQGGVCAGPAAIHHLVPRPFPGPVRRPPRRHRVLRPEAGGQEAGSGLPSPGDCAPSPGSTGTPWKKNSWITRRPGRGRCARARTACVAPPGAAGRPGWPRTSPARRRRGGGTPRRGRCCPAVQGHKLALQLDDVYVAGQPVEQGLAGGHGVLRGGPLPCRHVTTVRQNHRPGGL